MSSWLLLEPSVEHGLSHLLLIWVHFTRLAWVYAEATGSGLVEDLLFLLLWNVWEHFVDSGVVCWLEHDAVVGGVHFVDAHGSVLRLDSFFLFSHAVGHEEGLVLLLWSKPIFIKRRLEIQIWNYLHSHLLRWRLTLSSSVVLNTRIDHCVCKRTISHGMLIIWLEIGHHISKSCLSCWLCPFLLNLVHLLKILFSCRVKFLIKSFLSLKWSSFTFANIINLKTTSHCWVHHYLPRSLHLLKAIKCDII